MSVESDESLMDRYQRGDISAFERIYERYGIKIRRYIQRKIWNNGACEDVFQLVFIRLHEKKHLYDSDQPFAPWFFTLCFNVCMDHLRSERKYSNESVFYENSISKPSDEIIITDDISQHLPVSNSELALLFDKFVEQKNYEEIAQQLNEKPATIRKRVSRLIKKIQISVKRESL